MLARLQAFTASGWLAANVACTNGPWPHTPAPQAPVVRARAGYGDYGSGQRGIDERVRQTMRDVLAEIKDGSFAKKWIAESRAGAPELLATRAKEQDSQIERVGRSLRAMMPWLPKREFGAPAQAAAPKREPARVA